MQIILGFLSPFLNEPHSPNCLYSSISKYENTLFCRPDFLTPATSGSVAAAPADPSDCSARNTPSLTRHATWPEQLARGTTCCAATQTDDEGDVAEAIDRRVKRVSKMLYMAVAYACTIGGVANFIGTPTNIILIESLLQYALLVVLYSLYSIMLVSDGLIILIIGIIF